MKNKGFTLIELIGTIVILSLLLLIISPLVTRSIRNGVKNADEQAKTNIEMAAKNWKSDNKGNDAAFVTVSELINGGYLDEEVKLPSSSGQTDLSTACVNITLKTENPRKTYEFKYILPTEKSFKADLIIIATKNDGLEDAIKNMKNFIHDKTIIISVLNGIHSEKEIAKTFGWDNIIYSFFIGNSCIREGRNITLNGNYTFFIGEKDGSKTEKLERLEKFFKKTRNFLRVAETPHFIGNKSQIFFTQIIQNRL